MIDRLLTSGVIAVIRLQESSGDISTIMDMSGAAARALAAGGVDIVEITLTTPGALEAIAELASDEGLKGCMIGAGTVLDVKAARDVIARGARFVVSPAFDRFVVRRELRRCVGGERRGGQGRCRARSRKPGDVVVARGAHDEAVKLFP